MTCEVPRQVVRSNVDAIERWTGDASAHLAAAQLSRAALGDKSRKFSWDTFAALMSSFGSGRDDDELVAFGEEYVAAFPGFRELAALLLSTERLYGFVVHASPRYWSELEFDIRQGPEPSFRIFSRAPKSWAPNRTFFASAVGMFRNLGTLVGAPPAKVVVHELSAHHNDFEVYPPPHVALVDRFRDARFTDEMQKILARLLPLAGPGATRQWGTTTSLVPSVYDLMQRWGLTVAESRLVRRLGAGLSLVDAAMDLGIRHETARFHLKNAMSKAGVRRQVDLVRAMFSQPPEPHGE